LVSPFPEHCTENSARYTANDENGSSIRFFRPYNNALAPIAQIRVGFTRADSRPMSPAAGAFFVRRFRY
jgi:hypothetical protein